jgi:hypothetical protein
VKPTTKPSSAISLTPSLVPTPRVSSLPYDISYHNGQVMTGTVHLYNIYIGSFSTATMEIVDFFARHIGGSSWYNMFTAYYHIQKNVKTYMSNSATLNASLLVDPSALLGTSSLVDRDVQTLLLKLIQSGKLPQDTNGVYSVIFGGGVSVSQSLGMWPNSWCSYHSSIPLTAAEPWKAIHYAVIGDPSSVQNGQLCAKIYKTPTANNDMGADSIVTLIARGKYLTSLLFCCLLFAYIFLLLISFPLYIFIFSSFFLPFFLCSFPSFFFFFSLTHSLTNSVLEFRRDEQFDYKCLRWLVLQECQV